MVAVQKRTYHVPDTEELLTIIVDLSLCEGNATTNAIRDRLWLAFGDPTCPKEKLQSKLNRLFADGLIVKDGVRHHGAHYAITFKGKRKLAQCREQQNRAA